MPTDRQSALRHLIEYRLPLEPALAILSQCSWDVPTPVTWLDARDIDSVLTRYLNGKITAEQLTDWADLIECREDIGIVDIEELAKSIIYRLANPYLTGKISREVVLELQEALHRAQSAR